MPPQKPATTIYHGLLLLVFLGVFALTPQRASAATINKCGTISANETWTSGNVYIVTCSITINSGVTVAIQAGTVVKFSSGSGLTVNGTLDVQGTAGNRVVFTSYRDDSYGGDTNGDGTATVPAAGNWAQPDSQHV